MNAPFGEAPAHPLAAFGLDMLARGAARLRGDRPAIAEAGPGSRADALTYRELDELIAAFAMRAAECGLRPGDRAIIVGAQRIGVVAAIFGALAAGVEPVVAPAHAGPGALAFLAQATGTTALFAPVAFGPLDLEAVMLEAAADAPEIRFIGSLGPGEADGAIDFSPFGLAEVAAATAAPARRADPPRIGLVVQPDQKAPRATFITQGALVAQGLEVVSALNLRPDRALVSTLSAASLAGLVCGPVAALLSGAPLALFGPFEATGLAALLERNRPATLVAPAALAEDFSAAGLYTGLDRLVLAGHAPLRPVRAPCPVVSVAADTEGRIAIAA